MVLQNNEEMALKNGAQKWRSKTVAQNCIAK
jgi:hypothetical protein